MENNSTDMNNPGIEAGDILFGYEVIRKEPLEAMKGFYYELKHGKTGARHIHISNEDTENTFSVAFKTIPEDSTGVAHILEHTVLCGSEKYPVRDPFFFMIKRSLNTFMNAFTSSDWTMYPFSTQNRKDFSNLLDVYLDAAFFPKIESLSFLQEGWRLELEKDVQGKDSLVYKGVVYNEMKGAMSSPAQVMVRNLMNALYPSTTYGFNSGGEPCEITNLTHEGLIAFHKKYYHPCNAYFYTYGTFPLKEHLDFINEKVLKNFSSSEADFEIPLQPRFAEPKTCKYTYPLADCPDFQKKSQVTLAWLTAEISDSFEVLSLVLLGYILFGNASAPLRKKLIESGLGSSLCDATGYDSDNRDTFFACGLKDVDPKDSDKIEKIILDVLNDLVCNGIDDELIESAIHQLEFSKKEVTNSPYPYGLKQLLNISGAWFHGGDALSTLKSDVDLERIRTKVKNSPFFEERIKKYLIDNKHRVLMILSPDKDKAEKDDEKIRAKLNGLRKDLSEKELEEIGVNTENLLALQDKEEDVSCLPDLEIDDIPSDIKITKEDEFKTKPDQYIYKKSPSGIFYYTSLYSLPELPEHLIPLLPFYCSVFTRLGTKNMDYSKQAGLISRTTGGLGLAVNARAMHRGNPSGYKWLPYVMLAGKCLDRNTGSMFDIIHQCIDEYDFSDISRLKTLLFEYRAALESSIIASGHSFAFSLSSRNFSGADAVSELWHGVHQLKYIKKICEKVNNGDSEKELSILSEYFSELTSKVLNPERMAIASVGSGKVIETADHKIKSLYQLNRSFSDSESQLVVPVDESLKNSREGWITNSQVSFVAGTFQTVDISHPDSPCLSVISKIMKSVYLHKEIREKGGAYGGFAMYNTENGLFGFGSYRDPHIVNTLNVYDGAPAFINSGNITQEDIKNAILQICSAIDKPDTPAVAAKKAFFRKITGLTDEIRKEYKENLLKMDKEKVLEVAEKYFQTGGNELSVAVISGAKKLKESNEKLGSSPLKLFEI